MLKFKKEEGKDKDEDRASKRRRYKSISSKGSSSDNFIKSPSRR